MILNELGDLTKRQIQSIGESIGPNWPQIAKGLGFTELQIQDIYKQVKDAKEGGFRLLDRYTECPNGSLDQLVKVLQQYKETENTVHKICTISGKKFEKPNLTPLTDSLRQAIGASLSKGFSPNWEDLAYHFGMTYDIRRSIEADAKARRGHVGVALIDELFNTNPDLTIAQLKAALTELKLMDLVKLF